MAGIICLTAAIICGLIARVLLLMAACEISVWWAIGVFLPFGPLLFRLSYPEAARSSYFFRLGTLACVFLYVVLGPGAFVPSLHKRSVATHPARKGFASELVSKIVARPTITTQSDARSLVQRRTDNERELVRLNQWNHSLEIRKRDLLATDLEANRAYAIDLQEYQAAFATAAAEKQTLARASFGK